MKLEIETIAPRVIQTDQECVETNHHHAYAAAKRLIAWIASSHSI
jgi:hypothetical protein